MPMASRGCRHPSFKREGLRRVLTTTRHDRHGTERPQVATWPRAGGAASAQERGQLRRHVLADAEALRAVPGIGIEHTAQAPEVVEESALAA